MSVEPCVMSPIPATRTTSSGPQHPYPGLRPFRDCEESIFFGRKRQCAELTALLEKNNLLLIHGASGCGKSSLVAAGLLPFLRRDYRRAEQEMRDAIFRPSSGPYQGLANALAETIGLPDGAQSDAGGAYGYWADRLLNDRKIVNTIETCLEHINVHGLCLVVDQFEEIFAWQRHRRSSDVDLLIGFLDAVLKARSDRVFVLLTMRSDYIGACGRLPALAGVINRAQYLLPGLAVKGIARAIAEPARMFGGRVEPDLLDRLLLIATTGTDPLPIVQHVLKRMADLKGGNYQEPWTLTLEDLDTVSGETNPLSNHADQIADELERELTDANQAMKWIFRALFDIEKSGETIRRPRDFDELSSVVGPRGDKAAEAMTERIVAAFAAEGANFLVVSRSEPRRVDISHEALLRQWTRIVGNGPGQPSWKRYEIEDAMMWRNFGSPLLDTGILRGRNLSAASDFIRRMRAAPERARRYLSEEGDIDDVTKSQEWQRVQRLIGRSFWQRRAVWLTAIAVLVGPFSLAMLKISQKNKDLQDEHQNLIITSRNYKQSNRALSMITAPSDHASLASEVVDGQAVALLNTFAAGRLDRSGYLWVGDDGGSTATLRPLHGQTVVTHRMIKAGECYAPGYLLALRGGMPDPLNRSASRIGTVAVGQRICALDTPQQSPSGNQWWLHVATVTVFIHVTDPADPKVDAIRRDLAGQHFFLPATQQVAMAPGLFQVRYCHASDRDTASSIAAFLSQLLPTHPFQSQDLRSYAGCSAASPGIVEVWMDTAAGPTVAKPAATVTARRTPEPFRQTRAPQSASTAP